MTENREVTLDLDAIKFYNGAPDYDLAKDPRCLWGWGPSPGHVCFRPFGHDGMCWDGGDRPRRDGVPHQTSKRPSDWDVKGRAEANS